MKITINYKEFKITANITSDNTHIEDSYKVKKKRDMSTILDRLRVYAGSTDAIDRISYSDMIAEWRAHNLLYALGIARKRTKDVDLNENKWYVKVVYHILSCMYWK